MTQPQFSSLNGLPLVVHEGSFEIGGTMSDTLRLNNTLRSAATMVKSVLTDQHTLCLGEDAGGVFLDMTKKQEAQTVERFRLTHSRGSAEALLQEALNHIAVAKAARAAVKPTQEVELRPIDAFLALGRAREDLRSQGSKGRLHAEMSELKNG